MIFKDYYKILGLTTNRVNPQEIKNAYKEQAKKYHPDLNGGNRKFEERFKDINEAYKVLSDSNSKRKYDRIWYSNIGRKNKVGRKAPNSSKEALMGMFFGTTEAKIGTSEKAIKGENITTEINVSIEDAFLGTSKTLGLKTSSGKVKNYQVEIPAGIQNNKQIRLVGLGKKSTSGGKNGDLLVKINIKDSQKFKLQGNNIKADLLLTPWEASLGKKLKFESIDGDVTLLVPEGTQTGTQFTFKGKGYPNEVGEKGNLILEAKIMVPQNLTDEQKEYIKKMEKVLNFNPRV